MVKPLERNFQATVRAIRFGFFNIPASGCVGATNIACVAGVAWREVAEKRLKEAA